MIQFKSENYTTNEKIALKATEYAREKVKLDKEFWVFINDGYMFESVEHSAMYDKTNFAIRFNRDFLKKATEEQILKCAFHEVFHALQHQELLKEEIGIKSNIFSEEEIFKIKKEFIDDNYSDKPMVWSKMFVEQQAEGFALELYELFKKENVKI